MRCDQFPALLLNADFRPLSYFPLSVMAWPDVVSDVVRDRVTVVAEYDAWVRSPSTRIRLPSVVALRRYARGSRKVAFTRYNVFLRDRFACQYCGAVLAAKSLTFDHVVPRSRGGETSWENVVAACGPCNTAKGSSLAMRPRVVPRAPTPRQLLAARRGLPAGHLHKSWLDYLYWDSELEA